MRLPKRLLGPVAVAALIAGCGPTPPPTPAPSSETTEASTPPTVNGKAARGKRKPKERFQAGPRIPKPRKDL